MVNASLIKDRDTARKQERSLQPEEFLGRSVDQALARLREDD